MKRFISYLCLALLGVLAVSCYDDSALRAELDDHESRIAKLETLCKEMNTNISSLQTIVNAAKTGDYITDVSPVMEGGEEVGYTITFAENGKVTIYHGKDGANGADGKDGQDGAPGKDGADGKDGVDVGETPDISIKLDEDGVYYWTLNGEWLLDDNGNKIKAVGVDGTDGKDGVDGTDGTDGTNGTNGKDGVDGVTPQLKIEDDYWYVSYDNGASWTRLGKATGEDGLNGGDSIFSDVYEQGGYVYFVLSSGESYKVPTSASSALNIEFSVEQGVAVVPETTLKVKYTISGAQGNTLVRTIVSNDDDPIMAVVRPLDNQTGYIYIYLEDWFDDEEERDDPLWEEGMDDLTEGDYYDNFLSMLVVVSDSNNNQTVKALNFVEGVLESVDEAYLTDAVAGSVTAKLTTNVMEGSYEVVIPEKAQSWLSYAPTKAEMREDVLNFTVTANENDKFRTATVKLVNDMGQLFEKFTIVQRSIVAGKVMTFADPRVKAVCVGRYDKNLDGELTYEEAATVTDIEDLFLLEKNIVSFDEFEYFSSVTEIPYEFFANCEKLESVKLPESVIIIGDYAFRNCRSLKSIVIPEGLTNLDGENYDGYPDANSYWFAGCTALESVTLPSTLKKLPSGGFSDCSSLKSITIPEGINEIPSNCFSGCSQLSEINYKTPVIVIGSYAFSGCKALKSFDLSALNKYDGSDYYEYALGRGAFAGSGLTSVVIPGTVTYILDDAFRGCADLESVTLHDGVTGIGEYAFGQYDEYDYETSVYVSCSSLKNIDLPESLESIGYKAFEGSALEGQTIEGSSVKALVIPAKVTEIGSSAFRNCSNLSAVKMLPMYPPQTSSDIFDDYTTIYVHADALEAYKNSEYDWSNRYYTLLPYEMMSVSLGLEFETAGDASYDGNSFNFAVSAKVTGNAYNVDNVEEFGYYVKPVNDDYYYDSEAAYYPLETLDQAVTDTLSVYADNFWHDYENFVAKKEYQVGAYLRLVDGIVVTYDKQSVELVYDEPLSVTLSDYGVTYTSDSMVSFHAEYQLTGSYWMKGDYYEFICDNGSISVDHYVLDRNILTISASWYCSDNVANVALIYYDWNWTVYETESFELTCNVGETEETESLIYNGGFEYGTDGLTGLWGQYSYEVAPDGYDGQCLHFTLTEDCASQWDAQLFWPIGLEVGKTYSYSFWAKSDSNLNIQFLGQNESYSGIYKDAWDLTSEWQQYAGSFTYTGDDPEDICRVGVQFGRSDSAGAQMWIDEFIFEVL